ncbi:MAG: outer membrane beta-barrel protein [Alistipes sp.]
MKKLLLLLITIGLGLSTVFAAKEYPASGRVVDETGAVVAYATVVLLKDNAQVAGIATDSIGSFTLKVPAGNYTLSIEYLGYDPISQPIRIEANKELGDFTLKSSSTDIEGVVVKAQLIRREADRFIVDVANSPVAIGKNGVELLQHAPGIWIDNDKISINGKSGSKVYINDRELKMEPAQLLIYLKGLRAEDIQKIEVVPSVGADYDADSAGGIIKITLKKRREDGLDGSLSVSSEQGKYIHSYNPNGRINYHIGKFDLYASVWASLGTEKAISDENTTYTAVNSALISSSLLKRKTRNFGGSVGTIYQINDKHSVGMELEYWRGNDSGPSNSSTDFTNNNSVTHTDSRYDTRDISNHYAVTFNYIYKIDTLGSTFKFLGDYTRRGNDYRNDNFSRITHQSQVIDSLYQDYTTSNYNIFSAALALDKKLSTKWSVQAGLKYTCNDMQNKALYEYQQQEAWIKNENQSFDVNYRENIGAVYGILNANLGRVSIVAGLRGEYTYATGEGDYVKQNYFSLFPNVNISWSLKKDGSYSLIAQYARTLSRPRFWSLSPRRMQISDYTYQLGNPTLKPAYKNEISLTLVMKYKYTLTAGMNVETGEIQNLMKSDPEDPNKLCLTWDNFDTTTSYFASANLPFQFAKWWSMNANLFYVCQGVRITKESELKYNHFFMAGLSSTFTLPRKFFIDIAYNGSNAITVGNMTINAQHRLEASIKKRFCGDRLTATFSVQNLLDQGQILGAVSNEFSRDVAVKQSWNNRTYKIGLSYNFKSGKAFKNKSVENSSASEKSRL